MKDLYGQETIMMHSLLENKINLDKYVDMEYKSYPKEIGHWNPDSKDYVPSHREEKRLKDSIRDHNKIIDDFKRDLKNQRKVMEYI